MFLIAQLEALHALEKQFERVCAVANAYKHAVDCAANIQSLLNRDILATGAGYGIDGYGVGKFGGVEVLVTERDGTVRKFLGDVPWAIAGWFQFLRPRARQCRPTSAAHADFA